MPKSTALRGALLGVLLTCAGVARAADSPRVTAVLSSSQANVGQMVQLQIRVTGANSAEVPKEIAVDGLEIHQTTQQHESRFSFGSGGGDNSSSVTYGYAVLPLKGGAFTIPPQTIKVGGTTLQTPELRLAVNGSATGGGNARSAPGNQPNAADPATTQAGAGKLAFAELIVTKKSAYVGEMVPVEIRLGFFGRSRARLLDGPNLTGQGFTMQKLLQPDQPRLYNVNGKSYDVLIYKTAIAAARPGTFQIGPVEATALVAVARRPNSRSRSPFDIFNMDDPFSDPIFSDPFGSFGQQERITLRSEPASLEVKALPKNAPASFSGAVGNFAMTVDANPKTVQLGDPITVTANVSGRGNFDRVSAPTLESEQGWHKYPPSSKFKQDDNVGISGVKTFETVLSPNEKKQSIPPFHFSFFDPLKEQYVTLKSDAIPIRAEGGTAPASTPAVAATSAAATPTAAPAIAATAAPTPGPQDILYQLTDLPARPPSFTPLYLRPTFWMAQLAPLLALLGFVAFKIRRARLENREARRVAALHHEEADLLRTLRRDGASPQEYYSVASRAVRVKTALAKNIDPNMVDLDTAMGAFQLDEPSREQMRRLFEQSDEVRYSGSHNGGQTVSPERRREVLDLLGQLRT